MYGNISQMSVSMVICLDAHICFRGRVPRNLQHVPAPEVLDRGRQRHRIQQCVETPSGEERNNLVITLSEPLVDYTLFLSPEKGSVPVVSHGFRGCIVTA